MLAPLIVATAQPRCDPGELAGNARAHAAAVRAARARVVLFPELSLTGYELGADPVSLTDTSLEVLVRACAESDSIALAGAPIEDGGRRFIATLRIDAAGAEVAYRKSHLGGEEIARFRAGNGPAAIDLDGWRIGMGICKDTGMAEHIDQIAALDVDVYMAGLVHRRDEVDEQHARGERIAAACRAYVAFASFAGPTGGGYAVTAGQSTIWSPDGTVIARASDAPGDITRAELSTMRT